MSMDGAALLWYQWNCQSGTIRTWAKLKNLILHYAQPRNKGTLCEQWLAVKQEGTVAEYTQEFVEKITVLEKVPEFIMLGS